MMNRSSISFPVLGFLTLMVMLSVSSWVPMGTIVPLQQQTATVAPPVVPPTEDSWVIVDLPPNATQLEYGAEVYRLVCKACHGDRGQGLTDDWRAQWEPEDQNCWQSKCHALNHPPDGFYLPIGPAVVGPPVLIFETAQDLYDYNHNYMPWHDPGSMTQKESWSVTAYILKINNIDPGPELGPETASQIRLRGNNIASPSQAPVPSPITVHQDVGKEVFDEVSPIWIVAILAMIALALFGILPLIRRRGR